MGTKQINRKPSRAAKPARAEPVERSAKQKAWGETYGMNNFTLSEMQVICQNKIKANEMVVVEGPAGTGKTLAVLHEFAKEYLQDNTKQIIVIRTPVEAGMDKIGALPDDLKAKTEPHFASAKKILEDLLSKGKVENDLGARIHFKIPNYALGATFDNSLIMIDEAQQLPPLILKLLLERTGRNSKVVVVGDSTQLYVDARDRNGLRDMIKRFFFVDTDGYHDPKFDKVDYHCYSTDDMQRSDFCKTVALAYAEGDKYVPKKQ